MYIIRDSIQYLVLRFDCFNGLISSMDIHNITG